MALLAHFTNSQGFVKVVLKDGTAVSFVGGNAYLARQDHIAELQEEIAKGNQYLGYLGQIEQEDLDPMVKLKKIVYAENEEDMRKAITAQLTAQLAAREQAIASAENELLAMRARLANMGENGTQNFGALNAEQTTSGVEVLGTEASKLSPTDKIPGIITDVSSEANSAPEALKAPGLKLPVTKVTSAN